MFTSAVPRNKVANWLLCRNHQPNTCKKIFIFYRVHSAKKNVLDKKNALKWFFKVM